MNIFNIVATVLLAIVAFAVLGGIFTYFLWNWLMPDIFGLPTVTFLQAIGLNFLAAIFFKPASVSSSK